MASAIGSPIPGENMSELACPNDARLNDLEIVIFGDKKNLRANPGMEARLTSIELYVKIVAALLGFGIPSIVAAILHK
jgi:hypothetical protein